MLAICLLQPLALPVISHVVKHVHVSLPQVLIVHAPPLTDCTLVGQPNFGVDVAGVAHVYRTLGEFRLNVILSIVNNVSVVILLLVDVRSHLGKRRSLVVVQCLNYDALKTLTLT